MAVLWVCPCKSEDMALLSAQPSAKCSSTQAGIVTQTGFTVKTEIIENHARTLELPLLVMSVSQVRDEGESSGCVCSP